MKNGILNDFTTHVVQSALSGMALRQQVTAHNISNAETPGFKAGLVSFEEKLQRALEPRGDWDNESGELQLVRTHAHHLTTEGQMGADLAPQVQQVSNTTARNDQNNVDIDREMVTLADTAIHYQALSRLQAKRFAMLRAAVTEGRS
ncbi:MAG: Flagellar basal body rod protein FlgB [Anaerolineales bacterium]|nr:Flagellar basal body rod protein FlgB [Anaerolineales bacterium]